MSGSTQAAPRGTTGNRVRPPEALEDFRIWARRPVTRSLFPRTQAITRTRFTPRWRTRSRRRPVNSVTDFNAISRVRVDRGKLTILPPLLREYGWEIEAICNDTTTQISRSISRQNNPAAGTALVAASARVNIRQGARRRQILVRQ